jgi:hypothetical protein
MTLDDYKKICADTIGTAPAIDWPGAEYSLLFLLHNLYEMGREGDENERVACLDH